MIKIDHHNHIWTGNAVGEDFLDQDMSVEGLLRSMDADGLDMAGVCSIAQDIQNDYVAESVRKHPDRLFGVCFVDPREKNAVNTLRRYLDMGMRGLKLHPRLHGFPFSSHKLVDPLMAVCEEYDVSVFGHGGNEEFNMPFDFEEMARTFPKVKVILGHLCAPGAVDSAIMAATRTSNLYLDASLCSLGNLRVAIRKAGPEKVLMGADWPDGSFKIEMLKVELAAEGNQHIFDEVAGGTAKRIYKL